MDVTFNRNALRNDLCGQNLSTSVDKAFLVGLPLMSKPFHRPFQYIGMAISKVEQEISIKSKEAGNITVENDDCRMFLEAEGNFISYVEVDFKKTAPHYLNKEFDSEPMIGALSISVSELELIGKQTHFHTYYDHRKRLKIGVSCAYDGAPISVSFSSKYYGL